MAVPTATGFPVFWAWAGEWVLRIAKGGLKEGRPCGGEPQGLHQRGL